MPNSPDVVSWSWCTRPPDMMPWSKFIQNTRFAIVVFVIPEFKVWSWRPGVPKSWYHGSGVLMCLDRTILWRGLCVWLCSDHRICRFVLGVPKPQALVTWSWRLCVPIPPDALSWSLLSGTGKGMERGGILWFCRRSRGIA